MRHGRVILLVAVGVALAASTASRVQRWTSERRLWVEAVVSSNVNPRAWSNLGRLDALGGRPDLAADDYQQAIALAERPGRSRYDQIAVRAYAETNLALLHFEAGRVSVASRLVATAHDRLPNDRAIQQVSAWIRATD